MTQVDAPPASVSFRWPRAAFTLFDPGVIILLLVPWAMLAFSSEWIYGNRPCDAWYYLGYYLNLPQHLHNFPDAYYSTRLSALLPGYLVYRFLPPVAANLALHLGLYYLTVFALYRTLTITLGRRPAFLAALILEGYFHFHQAVGWDYVDGFGVTYAMLAAWAVTAAALGRRWRVALVLAGAAAAALVVTHLTFVLVTPGLAVLFFLLNRRHNRLALIPSLAWVTAGGLGLIFLLCCANWLINGRFLFFLPTLQFAAHFSGDRSATASYKVSLAFWLPRADFMVLPILLLLGVLPTLWIARRRGLRAWSAEGVAVQAQMVTSFLLFAASELTPSLYMLSYSIYASLLIPALFLALGGQLSVLVERLSRVQFAVAAVLALVVFAAPNLYTKLLVGYVAGYRPFPHVGVELAVGLAALIFCLRPSLVNRVTPRTLRWAAVVAAVVCLFPAAWAFLTTTCGLKYPSHPKLFHPLTALIPGGLALVAWWLPAPQVGRCAVVFLLLSLSQFLANPNRQHTYYATYRNADVFRVAAQSMRAIQEIDPTGQTYFWYNTNDPTGMVSMSIACTHNWGNRLINNAFPALSEGDELTPPKLNPGGFFNRRPEPGVKVAILSNATDALEQANASLQRVGLRAMPVAERELHRRGLKLRMTVVEITREGAAPAVTRSQPAQAAPPS